MDRTALIKGMKRKIQLLPMLSRLGPDFLDLVQISEMMMTWPMIQVPSKCLARVND